MCFALVSCEKDELLVLDPTAVGTEIPALPNDPISAFEDIVVSKALQEKIKANLLKRGKGEKSGLKNEQNFAAYLDTLLSHPAGKMALSDSLEGGDVLTYFVPTEVPTEVLNVVLHIVNEEVVGGYLNLYKMTPEFATRFHAFEVDFGTFAGELSVLPLSKLNALHYTRGAKNTEADCFTFIFDPRNVLGNNGGGGNDGGDIDGGPSGPNGNIHGGINWGNVGVFVAPDGNGTTPGSGGGTTPGSGGGTTPGSGGEGSDGPCYKQIHVLTTTRPYRIIRTIMVRVECPDQNLQGESDLSIENKNFSEDCVAILSQVGVITRPLIIPTLPAHTQEKIESAIAQTCFDNSAVLSIISVPAFEACVASGSTGPACITQQVVNYLNASGVGNVPGTSLVLNFDNLPHEQQAVFFHALVAAGGNEHVLAGAAFARRNISNIAISSNLQAQILYLSLLHKSLNNPGGFQAVAQKYLNIAAHLSADANVIFNSLVRNPSIVETTDDFFRENNYDEHAVSTLTLIASEIASGIRPDFVEEVSDDVLFEHIALYESALEVSIAEDCCGEIFIPTSTNPTFATGEFLAWHTDRFEEEVAILKYVYPEKYPLDTWQNRLKLKLEAERRVISGQLHLTLDLLGLIPGVGAAPDLVNGVWYTIEGDGLNAAFSFGAAIPLVGLLIGGQKVAKWLKFGLKTRRLGWLRNSTSGDIVFLPIKPSSGTWRSFWDFPTGRVGHHMLPQEFANHSLVQKAANVTNPNVAPFHMHDRVNAYPLEMARHISNHREYSRKVLQELNRWDAAFPSATPEQTAVAIRTFQDRLRDALTFSTGSIDDLTIPFIPNPL